MEHPTLFFLIFFASASVHGILEIKMSVGSAVTLPSGVENSLTLSSIEWFIFNNQTLIAVFYGKDVTQDMYFPLKGRLSLNTMTGNLEIRNLTLKDSRTYTVKTTNMNNEVHIYQVTLSVFARLPKPTLEEIHRTRADGLCLVSLRCSVSNHSAVKFNWSPDSLPRGCSWDLQHNSALMAPETTSERSAWCSPNQIVTIHCIANDSLSSTNSTKSVNCSAVEQGKDNLQKACSVQSGWIAFGILLLFVLGYMIYHHKGNWRTWRTPTQTESEDVNVTLAKQRSMSPSCLTKQ